jgi:hypothetical protein
VLLDACSLKRFGERKEVNDPLSLQNRRLNPAKHPEERASDPTQAQIPLAT